MYLYFLSSTILRQILYFSPGCCVQHTAPVRSDLTSLLAFGWATVDAQFTRHHSRSSNNAVCLKKNRSALVIIMLDVWGWMFSVWHQAAEDYGLSWLVCVQQDKHGGSDTRCPLMVKILDAVKGTPAGSVALKVSQKTADGAWTQIATGCVHCVTSQRLF